METFVASRMSKGNRIFPSKIIIDILGITREFPELFSGKEKTLPNIRIASVDIEFPFVGYSTISIETTGESRIEVRTFTKSEVKSIKELILDKM